MLIVNTYLVSSTPIQAKPTTTHTTTTHTYTPTHPSLSTATHPPPSHHTLLTPSHAHTRTPSQHPHNTLTTPSQTLRDGKSIVIEGQHIDPSMYLQEFRSAAPRQPYATTHTDHETIHKNNDEHKHKNNHDECIHNSNDEHTNKNDDINNNNSNPSAVTHPTPHPSTTRKHMHAALHTRRRSRDDSSIPHHPPHDVDGLLEHLVSAASGRTREHLVSATSNSVVGSNREHSVQGGGTVMLRLSELLGGGVGGVGGAHRTTHTGVVGRGGREGVDQLVDQWHARRYVVVVMVCDGSML